MTKFCTKCGSPLEDGKPCKCEKVVKETKKEVKSNSNFVDLLKEYLDVVKKTFSKPIDVLKENASEDKFNLSLVAIAIFGIVIGLFVCLIIKNTLGIYSGLVEIPYFKIFLVSLVLGAGTITIMALVGYVVVDKLFKGETSIKKMFVLFGLSSTIASVAILLSALCTLLELNVTITYAIIALGSLLNLSYTIKGIEYYSKLNINTIGYSIVLTNGVTSVIVYYIAKEILPKILS